MKLIYIIINVYFLFFFMQLNLVQAEITNKILIHVNDQIINTYELKNKIQTILFLGKETMSQQNINKTKNIAVQSLISQKLKKQEIENYNIDTNTRENVNNHLQRIASNFGTNMSGLKLLFDENKLDFEIYKKEIDSEYKWQQLIYDLHKNKLNIDKQEIEVELKELLANKSDVEEFKIAEIEVNLIDESENKLRINEVIREIKKIGFENAAIKYSISSSALDGGNLGWINSKSLSKKIFDIIKNFKIGEISKPINQINSVLFLKLLDKKKYSAKNINLDEIRKKIIENKTNDLLNLYSNNYLSKVKNSAFIKTK